MTIYGYARVSSDDQTLEPQFLALTRAGVEASNVASDDAVSGKVAAIKRTGLAGLLSRLQKGDTLVVYSLSRAGRSTLDVLELLQSLEKRGILFKSLTESFDTSSPTGRAMLGIIAVFAQLERETIVERTNAGIQAAKARGVKFGRAETAGRRDAVARCRWEGKTKAETARELGLPYNAVKRMWPEDSHAAE